MLNNMLLASASEEKNFIEDLFSCYLYTGNGSTQTITNGIDLAGNGGLVWIKQRTGTASHYFQDTSRGITYTLSSDTTSAQAGPFTGTVTSATSNGFSLGTSSLLNGSGTTYASWTFRKAPKFFTICTWTGNNTAGRQISHDLGSVPGMIIVKTLSKASNWLVYHRASSATPQSSYLSLHSTSAVASNPYTWNNTAPTATTFTVGEAGQDTNDVGATYVAYLFAHDTTADGVIQCGSFSYVGSTGTSVSLGWEPQFILYKSSTANGGGTNWQIHDTMRGFPVPSATTANLTANGSGAESTSFARAYPTATGFALPGGLGADDTYIYLAIRRGPMRVPTDATKVFNPVTYTGAGAGNRSISTTNRPDTVWWASRDGTGYSSRFTFDRLRGVTDTGGSGSGGSLALNTTDAEYPNSAYHIDQLNNTSVRLGSSSVYGFDASGLPGILWNFTRAPGFFDVVCYSGTGSARTVSHNLGVAPELIIAKNRTTTGFYWPVFCSYMQYGFQSVLRLNETVGDQGPNSAFWGTSPTSSVFSIGSGTGLLNQAGDNYVAYLFASCPSVSKVGSYTGNGSSLNIDCGFTNGARFVIIKAVSTTGHWRIWDSARGIVAGNDPFLMTSSTAAENNTTDDIDPLSSGFTVNLGGTGINESGWQYIYLAIA